MKRRWRVAYSNGMIAPTDPVGFWQTVEKLGPDLAITIDRWRPNTSTRQYAYYYGIVLPMISDHTGHSTEELDLILKHKFLYEWTELGSELVRKVISKTRVTTEQFSTYLEEVIRWAATELNVVIPDPSRP